KSLEFTQREPREIARLPLASHRRQDVPQDRYSQHEGNDAVKYYSDEHGSSGHSSWRAHGNPFIAAPEAGFGYSGPGNRGRCAASQATTSEISCADIGLPGTLLRQSGAPSSGRPVITIVRRF